MDIFPFKLSMSAFKISLKGNYFLYCEQTKSIHHIILRLKCKSLPGKLTFLNQLGQIEEKKMVTLLPWVQQHVQSLIN